MLWKKIALLVFLIGITISSNSQARSPAVLPVSGISIDEMKTTPPNQAKSDGFEFESANKNEGRTVSSSTNPVQMAIEKQSKQNINMVPISLTLFILCLPFFVWVGLMRNVNGVSKETENVISLATKQAESANQNSEDKENDIPKAS